MNPIISVIVAIYQAEPYLRRCVDSILSQTFADFELLLIDDGSTDGSSIICDEYAKIDNRIRVYHKNNEGLSLTRQFGVDHSLGVFSIHCDPDDWIEPNMLELLYNKAIDSSSDLVMCDVIREYEGHKNISSQFVADLDHNSLLSVICDPLSASVCNKLIRQECYRKYDVKYVKEVTYAEDLYVMLQLLKHPIKVEYVNCALYHYDQFVNTRSITRTASISSIVDSIKFMEEKLGHFSNIALFKLKREALVLAYKSSESDYMQMDTLYHEVDKDLLCTGIKHPIDNWIRLVIALRRYGLRRIGDGYARLMMELLSLKRRLLCKK